MQMTDRLAAVLAGVYYYTKAFLQLFFFGDGRRPLEELTHQFLVIDFSYVLFVFSWNNKDMCWSLGADVSNSKRYFVLMNDCGGDFSLGNTTEQARTHLKTRFSIFE